jgi:hypothetical protein
MFNLFFARGASRLRGTPIAAALIVAAVLIAAFRAGLDRGMDHVAAFGPEGEQTAITVALSDMVYSLNGGYVGYTNVLITLKNVWNRGATGSHDPILLENNRNRDLLNEAIRTAANLGPQQPGFLSDRTLITTIYDDVGYVDYVKVAFRLFGFRIEAMYYTFFVALALSSLVFIITFAFDRAALSILVVTLFALFAEMHTAIFNEGMPTLHGMRHGSTLALIPAWHFAFLILRQRRADLPTVALAVVQVAILILAIKMRGSAAWAVVFVLAVSLFQALRSLWPHVRPGSFAMAALTWPMLVMVGSLLLHAQYMRIKLHPVYSTEDVIPYHGLWHSAYLGLALAPDMLPGHLVEALRQGDGWDQVGYRAAFDYLDTIHFFKRLPQKHEAAPFYISPLTGTIKFGMHDRIMRAVFRDAVKAHPMAAIRLYLTNKPVAIRHTIAVIFSRTNSAAWFLIVLAGALAAVAVCLAGGLDLTIRTTVGCAVAAVPFTALPTLWAYPSFNTVADIFLATLIVLQAAFAAAGMMLVATVTATMRRTA